MFEVGCLHQHTILVLHSLNRNRSLLRILRYVTYLFLLPITMWHASSWSSEIGRFYNFLYNLWPELSVLGLRVEVLQTDLCCEGCYWESDVISFCLLNTFIQGGYYSDSSSSSEDLVGSLFKIVSHWFPCRTVDWQSQDGSQQLPSALCYGDRQWLCSCDLSLGILYGHWVPITFLSCLLWKLFSLLCSSFDTSQVLQLYNSTLFTSVSCSRIPVVSFAFQFFFQIVSFFARAIVANSFLL